MTMAAMSIVRSVDTANLIAGNLGFHQAAVQSTELGIETAIPVLEAIISTDNTTSDDTGQNYYASYSGTELPALSAFAGNEVTDPGTSNTVNYAIERMCNDTNPPTTNNCLMEGTDPLYRISTLVAGPRDTSANTQVYVMGGSWFNPECAVTAQTYIDILGAANITGDSKCVHSNGHMNVPSLPSSIGEVRAVGTVVDAAMIGLGGGSSVPGQPPVTLPEVIPSDFKTYADYTFETDGNVYKNSDGSNLGTPWLGWSRTTTPPYIWNKSDSSPSDSGLYYFEGNVVVSGSVGTSGTPWDVSFISTGSIQIASENYFQNYQNTTPGFPPGVNSILMMTGGDLEYNGNPTVSVQGIMAVREEININGNPNLDGYFIVTNATDPGDPVGIVDYINHNEFSGGFSLYFDSSLSLISPWSQPTQRIVWRTLGQ